MGFGETTGNEIERVATEIVDAAFKVHSRLGPGLLESAYEAILCYELRRRGLKVECQVAMPIVYDDVTIDVGYRIDMIVNDCIIIELKSVEKLIPLHDAQLMTYLKLAKIRLGFLINFNTRLIKDGIKRIVL